MKKDKKKTLLEQFTKEINNLAENEEDEEEDEDFDEDDIAPRIKVIIENAPLFDEDDVESVAQFLIKVYEDFLYYSEIYGDKELFEFNPDTWDNGMIRKDS